MVRVFAQAFYEKNCDHADHVVVAGVFGQAFLKRVFGQAFFEKGFRSSLF